MDLVFLLLYSQKKRENAQTSEQNADKFVSLLLHTRIGRVENNARRDTFVCTIYIYI
jgi:hypothetical protein